MDSLFKNPFVEKFKEAKRVLIAGAGGGFDIYCGIPLYFALRECGKEVHLANLSFTRLRDGTVGEALPVTAESDGPVEYFPEKWLSMWLASQSIDQTVHAFYRTGVAPLVDSYTKLVRELQIDAIILVDGGTDSLMRGDEVGLGTPEEDLASLAAVDVQEVDQKLLVCVGFGIDAYHGVCHAHFLESVAAIAAAGGYLGAFALLNESPHVVKYLEAVKFASSQNSSVASIVNTSVASAIEGNYGNYHKSQRTAGSTLWINPLMSLCWCFDLASVVERSLLIDSVRETQTYFDISLAIERVRDRIDVIKRWQDIPV